MAELFFEDETIGMQDPSLPSNLTQDLGASTYRAPNFTQQNLGTRAFPHDPSVFDQWGNRAMEEEKGNYPEPPRGLSTLKNWASNKLGTGVNWASDKLGTGVNWGKMAVSGIGNAIMPGLGFVLGAMNPEKMRGYNYDEGRFNTQEEYEANRSARQQQARIGYMMDRRAAGKGFSQKNLNEQTMGLAPPGFYGNQWGGTLTGIDNPNLGKAVTDRTSNVNSPQHPGSTQNNPGVDRGIGSPASRGKQERGGHHFYRGGIANLWPR